MAGNSKTFCKDENLELRKELVIDGTGQLRVPHVSQPSLCLPQEIDNDSLELHGNLRNHSVNNQRQENKEKLYVVSIVKGELEIVPANTIVTSEVTNSIKSENDKSFLVKEELKTDCNDQAIDEVNQDDADLNLEWKIDHLKVENGEELYADNIVKEELIVEPEVLHESFASDIPADASCPRDPVVWDISEEGKKLNKDIKLEFQPIHENTITESTLETNDIEYKNGSLDVNNLSLLNVRDSYIAKSLDGSGNIAKDEYFTCNKCEYKTTVIGALNRHIKLHELRKFECDLCGFRSITKHHLITHITYRHSKVDNCTICNYKSTSKSILDRHLKLHNKEKHNVFIHSSNAKMDTSKKQYNCTYCTYSSNRKYSLTLHIRAHTGEKPHRCTYCKYSSSRKSTLKTHIRIHTGEKPYTCTFCKLTFTECSTFKRHLVRRH